MREFKTRFFLFKRSDRDDEIIIYSNNKNVMEDTKPSFIIELMIANLHAFLDPSRPIRIALLVGIVEVEGTCEG